MVRTAVGATRGVVTSETIAAPDIFSKTGPLKRRRIHEIRLVSIGTGDASITVYVVPSSNVATTADTLNPSVNIENRNVFVICFGEPGYLIQNGESIGCVAGTAEASRVVCHVTSTEEFDD